MQYIPKTTPKPLSWNTWFSIRNGGRSRDFGEDRGNLDLLEALRHLTKEQSGLCAYCQKKLLPGYRDENLELQTRVSIEHVIPKSCNKTLSTDYHNLVAVCNERGVKYCETIRGSQPITPLIFYNNCTVREDRPHPFFSVYDTGEIAPREGSDPSMRAQVKAFIDILKLNHPDLVKRRMDFKLAAWITAFGQLPTKAEREAFLRRNMRNVLQTPGTEFRQFLLIWLKQKIG